MTFSRQTSLVELVSNTLDDFMCGPNEFWCSSSSSSSGSSSSSNSSSSSSRKIIDFESMWSNNISFDTILWSFAGP